MEELIILGLLAAVLLLAAGLLILGALRGGLTKKQHKMLVRIFAETCLKKTIRLDNGAVLRVAFDEKTKKFKSAKVLF